MNLFDIDAQIELGTEAEKLAKKIKSNSFTVGVAGLGYVGLPIALAYAKKGIRVLGVDFAESKVNSLIQGNNYIEDLDDDEIREVVNKGLLKASTSYEILKDADVIFLCVPTPFNAHKEPDISFIISSGIETSKYLNKGALVILKSTTFPGTTEEFLIPELEKSGMKSEKDFFVAFSPERVDPGNPVYSTENTPIVVGGTNVESTYLCALANSVIIPKVFQVSNTRIAELEKLLENIFRSVNIALMNELALLAERLPGINIWEVIDAAATKPFGFMKFTPGPGIGGHCIPIDPYYLSWLARKYDFETKFITLSANTNEGMPYYIVNKVIAGLARQEGKLDDAKVLIVGVAFKKNVKDLRNSPAEAIIRILKSSGINNISYIDPFVEGYSVDGVAIERKEISSETFQGYNCSIIITDHDDFDAQQIVDNSLLVFDTRNMTKDIKSGSEKVNLLGKSL